ncbi:MAG: nitroreductase family protein [Anaerolineaceae bacterium]|nr:nitroreductase family protein [Anaerolineaceae bacterium]
MNLNKIKNIAKKVLAVPFIRKSLNRYNLFLYKILSINKVFAIPYYFLFNRSFDREIFAYSTAVYAYNRNIHNVLGSNVVLRRNIHRLEKGLIMEKRRSLFALDYIQETVERYASIMQKAADVELDLGEVHWAHDVLTEYFNVVDHSHKLIKKMKEKFDDIPAPAPIDKKGKFIPYESKKRSALTIPSYEEFLALSLKRRSVRWFKDKKVPREDVDKALKAASLAPSACNRQPFKYRIFDDPELTKEIAGIPFGASSYSDNIPMIIVVVGNLSNYFSSRDRHLIYVDASLSVMAFMYALETLGLSSVGIHWPDLGILEHKMKKKLNLKPYERPIIMLGVGYAKEDGKIPYSKKKSLGQLRSYNDLNNKS